MILEYNELSCSSFCYTRNLSNSYKHESDSTKYFMHLNGRQKFSFSCISKIKSDLFTDKRSEHCNKYGSEWLVFMLNIQVIPGSNFY
jgi:hypothetical protein